MSAEVVRRHGLRAGASTGFLDEAPQNGNWNGHSVGVQNDDYSQVDDHHFDVFNKATFEVVALQIRETAGTGRRPKEKTREKHKVFCGSLADFVTLRKSLDAPERGSTSAVSPAVQADSDFGGLTGGLVSADSRLADLVADLKADGFTTEHLRLIDSAMGKAGLKFAEAPDIP